MSAESRYKITAEDGTRVALESIKGNLNRASQAMEGFRKIAGMATFAVGGAGLVSALGDAITTGAKWNATLAATQASMTTVSGSVARLKAGFAEGLAPAIAMAADELAGLQKLGGGLGTIDKIIAGFKSINFSGGFIPFVDPRRLQQSLDEVKARREALSVEGQQILAELELTDARERAAAITASVATASEQYNERLDEMSRLMNRDGVLSLETYTRAVAKLRAELFKTSKPIAPLIDVSFTRPLEVADETLEDILDGLQSIETIPAAIDVSKWDLMWAGIKDSARDASTEMNRTFTDALFDMGNALDTFADWATSVLKQIADALVGRYITGPILAGVGLGPVTSGGGGGGVGTSPAGGGPGIVDMNKALAPVKAAAAGVPPVNVNVYMNAIDARTGSEFLAGNARLIGALVQRESQKHGQRGPHG